MNYEKKYQKITGKLFLLSIGISFFACSPPKEENLRFSDWDQNEDNLISKTEFTETFTKNYYEDWDSDNEPYLDDEDFFKSVYRVWDNNSDMKLESDEWVIGYDYLYGNYVLDDFEVVDSNADGFVEYAEYEKILAPTDIFVDWDSNNDQEINEVELASGLFEVWDKDNSKFLELDEYMEFDSYYLDL